MITIGGYTIFLNEITEMTLLGIGKNIKDVLLEYYSYNKKLCDFFETAINDNKIFRVIAKNENELQYIFEFFLSVELKNTQFVLLRTADIPKEVILDNINLYNDDVLLDKFIVKVDDLDYIILRDYKLFLEKFLKIKSTISTDSSPLEIIKYAYDYTKSREYKNVPDDEKSLASRNLTTAFLYEYIVCAGFTKIFNALLREFNIPCVEYHYRFKGDEKGHSVSLVNVNDSKYGINGLYYFDVTGDCYSKNSKNNEAKYKYFMQTINDYKFNDLAEDSFNLLLNEDKKELIELMNFYRNNSNIDIENIFDNKNFENILEIILDTLQIYHNLFIAGDSEIGYTDNPMIETAQLYQFYLDLHNKFGKTLDSETFIKLLANTGCDYNFAVKAFLSKFDEIRTNEEKMNLEKIKRK